MIQNFPDGIARLYRDILERLNPRIFCEPESLRTYRDNQQNGHPAPYASKQNRRLTACMRMMRTAWQLIALLTFAAGLLQGQQIRIGIIDFFGTEGIDLQKARAAIPVHVGDQVTEDQESEVPDRINRAIEAALGHLPTDVAMGCCDNRGDVTVYVGLGGSNRSNLSLLPAPTGHECLSNEEMRLYDDAMNATTQAVQSGNSGEDHSRGYALSKDPALRAKQLAMHEYAIAHASRMERALQLCANQNHRAASAQILGYASTSKRQIAALVHASRDSDGLVRNNAVRALAVLAGPNSKIASEIPADSFVEMLNFRQLGRPQSGFTRASALQNHSLSD